MFLADLSRNSQHKRRIISFSRLKNCLKNCSSEDIGSQMNRLFLYFEKPFFNLIKHGDIPSPHGDIPVVFYHFIEIESKTTVAKTEGLSKFLPIWSMFKDAPSMKDVGSMLAWSVRSDFLFCTQHRSFQISMKRLFNWNNLHYSHFHFVRFALQPMVFQKCFDW